MANILHHFLIFDVEFFACGHHKRLPCAVIFIVFRIFKTHIALACGDFYAVWSVLINELVLINVRGRQQTAQHFLMTIGIGEVTKNVMIVILGFGNGV